MATAAVMSASSAHMGMFKGDAAHMVDLLVASCQQRPPAASYTGFGRELVPCADAWLTETDDNRLTNVKTAGKASHKHARPNGKAPGSPQHKKAATEASATKKAAAATPKSNAIAIPVAPKAASSPSRRGSNSSSSSADAGFTCPAVAPSPKPEALPMPTSGLLGRARGRSPSPDTTSAMEYEAAAPLRRLQFVMA